MWQTINQFSFASKTLLLCVLLLFLSLRSFAQDREVFQQFLQATNNTAAQRLLRDGRDLISERKWADAVGKFNDFIRAYPRDKNLDAALYWLAFCLKQQGKPLEAEQALERLLKEYPRSNWKDDARALRIELAEALNALSASLKGGLERQQEMRERDQITRERDQLFRERDQIIRGGDQRTSDTDDPNEIKLVALQSLFQADPERALNVALAFLRADAKASPTFQEAALGLIARRGGERAWPVLIETARNQSLAESVREQAFYWIAQQRQPQALDTLVQLYDAEKNQTLKERLMYWLAQSDNEQARAKINAIARSDANQTLRERAIYWIAQRSGVQAFKPLNELYATEKDATIKERILYWFAQSNEPRAQARIVEIALGEANHELRDKAIYWIAQRGDADATEILIRLYDGQQAEETKERVLYWLSQRGGKAGLQKLFAVAKNDSSQRLRERAVYYLGQSNDPEALKLLEQILK